MLALIFISSSVRAVSINNNENQHLEMCVSHFPPYQIVLAEQTPMGENITATTHFFNKLGFTIRFTQNNSFRRCLGLLKAGKVDIMSGLLDAPERRNFAHLLVYGSLDQKSFFVRKNSLNISTISDLKGLKVAVIRGMKQFEKFDNAPDGYFEKIYFDDLDAAFRVLVAGKVDVVISTDFHEMKKIKNRVRFSEEITEVIVQLDDANLLFTGLSKKSKAAHLAPKLQELSRKMYKDGEFHRVISAFKKEHREYY
jgi:ABC-type amino acid transport substrate-binding protein